MRSTPFTGEIYYSANRTPKPVVEQKGAESSRIERKRKQEQQEREELLKAAHQKAVDLFHDSAIDSRSFEKYDQRSIDADLKYVAQMESVFHQDTPEDAHAEEIKRRLSLVLEAIVHEQAELSNWLGPSATTHKTSRFDDIASGVDSIVEFTGNEPRRHRVLAIDVTYTKELERKIHRIKQEIDEQRLTYIKYFESADETYKGTLSKVPRVLIGIDPAKIFDLAQLWIAKDQRALAKHPIQIQILEEITMQLKTFHRYAIQRGQRELVEIFEGSLRLVERTLEDSGKQAIAKHPATRESIERDRVYQNLRSGLWIFQT